MSQPPRRRAAAAATLAAFLLAASPAAPVVISPTEKPPDHQFHSFIGTWNGASAVAIGEHWIITARHVAGLPGGIFSMNGDEFAAERIIPNRSADIQLVRLAKPLPGWHSISTVAPGQHVVLGGAGFLAGDPVAGGIAWSRQRGLALGHNIADAVGARIVLTFDDPAGDNAVPGEATFALFDSGGGVFVPRDEGALGLVGIATSISGLHGVARFGSFAFAINLATHAPWITAIIEPGTPVASSLPPPARASSAPPPPVPAPAAATPLAAAAALAAARRRR